MNKKNSQCHIDLNVNGFSIQQIELPDELKQAVTNNDFNLIDQIISKLVTPKGELFVFMSQFCPVKSIEHIISLRDANNEWEEDGIWHDDGSRVMAFSLSLTVDPQQVEGGILEIRKKGDKESLKISTPTYGDIIVFQTGQSGYEHKINQVFKGKRLIIAGWCYPE
ncbi:MAG: 2OG-Fe(II) oxygenase [Halobacteriovoraceae bacterium]|jgi:Rps23 Pro-64 3,4-dihydroxylase Tpa1-like proline 4-hydroxylase|nr:2OG-Fe(II) oxygenase [Halobacteriovoraceae bacterium]